MTRTMWIALFCLMGLSPAIAIKIVMRPAAPAVEAAQDQNRTEMALAPNEVAKSDRLPLPDIRAEAEVMPAPPEAVETPREAAVETPATRQDETVKTETVKIPHRRWQDANASVAPSGPRHRGTIDRKTINSAANAPPRPRAEAFHCRQDAVGGILRSLDLSPRCHL